MKKIIVIAPHPDDEVLGCGGTIKKHVKEGDEVYLCIVTSVHSPKWSEQFIEERGKEIENSRISLGIKQVFLLGYPAAKLDTVSQMDINDNLQGIIEKVKPDIAYIPFASDINKDHRIVHESSLVALRPQSGVSTVISYEALSETDWGLDLFKPNVYVGISEFFEDKIKAMKCYHSEIRKFPHPRSLEGIEILAKKRGMESGLMMAESFLLIRDSRK
jgi:N-acetylglucosamine malate deacetylase 1